jgi:hypothetical protein
MVVIDMTTPSRIFAFLFKIEEIELLVKSKYRAVSRDSYTYNFQRVNSFIDTDFKYPAVGGRIVVADKFQKFNLFATMLESWQLWPIARRKARVLL